MPECKYRLCENTFEPILRYVGTPMEKKYCCRKHKLAEKYLVDAGKKVKKPMYEFECRYRRCKQIRKTYDKRRRYCNRDHQQAEGRIIRALKQSQEETDQRLSRKNARIEARMDASLNCTLHRGCLDAEKLPCLNCTKKIWQKDTWKHEPGVLICNETDYTDHIA